MVKFFLWNSMYQIIPLVSSLTYNLSEETDDFVIKITNKDIESGGYAYGSKQENSKRLRVNRLIPVTKGSVLKYNLYGMHMHIDAVSGIGAETGTRSGWITSSSGTYTAKEDGYLGITLRVADDTKISIADYKAELSIEYESNTTVINEKDVVSGGYSFGAATENNKRLRVNYLIPVTKNSVVKYDVGTMQIIFNVITGEEATGYLTTSGWINNGSGEYTITADGYLAIILAASDYNQAISAEKFAEDNAEISISHSSDITIIKNSDIENGGWSHGNKNADYQTTRLRVNRLIPVTKGSIVTYYLNSQQIYIYEVEKTGATTSTAKFGWSTVSGTYTVNFDGYLAIVLADSTNKNNNIAVKNYDSQISIMKAAEPINTTSTYPESHRIIKQFGGEGNDWSFVYLPDDYYTNTSKYYPFVIANHGNGWKMDGKEQNANWTKRTMYVPMTDADYKANNTQYIGTDDSSLWYSNPTIEALLDAGYIVAGCQNYADTLYGNDNCRNACVDFYEYLVREYRVKENSCYMIGASNGAMTSLNASYLLGEKVRGLILQYPLTCLKNQYFGYSSHQDGIRNAYGISNDIEVTRDNFLTLIGGAEFDPLYASVENGVKQGYFPPTKFYYSATDTVTPASLNTLPLYDLLAASGKEVVKVQVDTDGCTRLHGDYAHFKPNEYVQWFNSHQ